MRTRPHVTVLVALLTLIGGGGCRQPAAGPRAVGERIENPQVGVAIAALPSFFRVAVNEDARLELVPAAEGGTGRLTIVAGPLQTAGVNLVEAVKGHREEILARPDGDYRGQQELDSQLGTAFYSRGRYTAAGGVAEEETVVFLVHPAGGRTLELRYRYPAAGVEDTRVRIEDQLFAVLEELEPLEPEPRGKGLPA